MGWSSGGRAGGWRLPPAAGGELRLHLSRVLLHLRGCSSEESRGSGEGSAAALRRGSGAAGRGGWRLTAGVAGTVAVWSGTSAALQTHKTQTGQRLLLDSGRTARLLPAVLTVSLQ